MNYLKALSLYLILGSTTASYAMQNINEDESQQEEMSKKNKGTLKFSGATCESDSNSDCKNGTCSSTKGPGSIVEVEIPESNSSPVIKAIGWLVSKLF